MRDNGRVFIRDSCVCGYMYMHLSVKNTYMKYAFFLALAGVGLVPFLSSAATYHYVNSQGETDTIEAPDAQTAIATAPNIASNSGVAIDMGLIEDGTLVTATAIRAAGGQRVDGISGTYHYVTAQGVTDSVSAPSASVALEIAPNIASNSGVAIDNGFIEDGMVVESVAN